MAASNIAHANVGHLVLLVILCGLAAGAHASCNYAASCSNEGLSGTILRAICVAVNGNAVSTSINLNAKISNNNGRLVCPGANFAASCSNIGLNGENTLTANCRSTSGSLIQTNLDLNNCISNNNGNLQFCV